MRGSPFDGLRITPGPVDPASCTVSGLGVSSAEAGVQASFTVVVKDAFGNGVPLETCGLRAEFLGPVNRAGVSLQRPVSANPGLALQRPGAAHGFYTPRHSGDYILQITTVCSRRSAQYGGGGAGGEVLFGGSDDDYRASEELVEQKVKGSPFSVIVYANSLLLQPETFSADGVRQRQHEVPLPPHPALFALY